jgi:serine/threonine-protein kinase
MQPATTKNTVDIRRDTRQCPTCGQRFSRDAAFCPFDGVKLVAATFDTSRDPLLGTTVDSRYQVLEVLGEGGMGRVYKARHASLERAFAMKVLRRDLARDEGLAGRFIQEARTTASVRHPNIVEITDFGNLPDGVPYFVMELLVGQTLGDVIKGGGPLPAGRAARILTQVARALAAAHAAGVVHRDLKPDNIFLVGGMRGGEASDDVRVVDFGAAKVVGASRMTKTGVVFGTPHYMSPEQASGQPVDHRADVYALGVIMYEMFVGRPPFEADTYMGVLTQHMFVQPVPPSEVNAAAKELGALEEITLLCLAKKPEERFQSMDDLVLAIDSVVKIRKDGGAEVAAKLAARPSGAPPSLRYRMADELEPPTLAEMRVAIDSVLPPRRPVPWGWIAGIGGAALFLAVALGVVAHGTGTPRAVPTAVAPGPAVSVHPAPEIPPPPPVAASAAEPPAATAASSIGAPTPPAASSIRRVPSASPPPRRVVDDVPDPFLTRP